ncbi:hypothetical protein MBLNU459_g4981t1 [Dothideomycetes sp. NU459]
MALFGFNPFAFLREKFHIETTDTVISGECDIEDMRNIDTVISGECDIEESIPDWIEQFVRFSKHGQFGRAESLFEDVLRPHLPIFPVAAEYAQFLLDQGNFGLLEDFLTAYLEDNHSFEDDEIQLLRLLLALAKIYTRHLLRGAIQETRIAQKRLSSLTVETIDDVQQASSMFS